MRRSLLVCMLSMAGRLPRECRLPWKYHGSKMKAAGLITDDMAAYVICMMMVTTMRRCSHLPQCHLSTRLHLHDRPPAADVHLGADTQLVAVVLPEVVVLAVWHVVDTSRCPSTTSQMSVTASLRDMRTPTAVNVLQRHVNPTMGSADHHRLSMCLHGTSGA